MESSGFLSRLLCFIKEIEQQFPFHMGSGIFAVRHTTQHHHRGYENTSQLKTIPV